MPCVVHKSMQREMIIFEWKCVCVEIVVNAQIHRSVCRSQAFKPTFTHCVHIHVRFMKIIIAMLPLFYLIIVLAQLIAQILHWSLSYLI